MFPTRLIWLLLSVPPLALGGGVAVTSHLESRRSFCNACHLPSGSILHAAKMRRATEEPGLDLTGVHFAKALHGGFTCADCHRGAGWQERSHVLLGSALNSLRYVVGSYREPAAIARPIINRACTQCHAGVTKPGNKERFHGIDAHQDQSTILCTGCHLGHASGDDPARQALRLEAAATGECRRCHKGSQLADNVQAVLTRYDHDLLTRMERR